MRAFLKTITTLSLLVVVLSGCSPNVDVAPVPEQIITPDTVEAALSDQIKDALTPLAASQTKLNKENIAAALTAAGVATDALEIQDTTTPTNLTPDSLGLAVPTPYKCVFAHIQDHQVTTAVLEQRPDDTCFVGGKHNPDTRQGDIK